MSAGLEIPDDLEVSMEIRTETYHWSSRRKMTAANTLRFVDLWRELNGPGPDEGESLEKQECPQT